MATVNYQAAFEQCVRQFDSAKKVATESKAKRLELQAKYTICMGECQQLSATSNANELAQKKLKCEISKQTILVYTVAAGVGLAGGACLRGIFNAISGKP
jgi:hypothetical protein